MAWFRTNRGVVAWLAFFALACQFAFSFGHVHVGKSGAGLATQAAAVQTTDAAADAPPSPPHKKPAGLAVDFCAVCANISLAGSLLLPILAIILAPDRFTGASRWSLAASEPASFGHLPFSARGPPHA
jgi:hypothetical protein